MDEDRARQVLQQLDAKARETGRAMNIVRAQVASKEREGRISQLTLTEIQALPADKSKLYKGVGKMFVLETPEVITKELKVEQKEASEVAAALRKKQKFLESEFEQTQRSVQDIFRGRRS